MGKKSYYEAIATLIGVVIGAGIIGIPYVFAQAGIVAGIINLAMLGLAITVLHLCLGEICLRTPGNHQLPGYARTYLGKWGGRLMALSMVITIYGAMIAYTLGEAVSLSETFLASGLVSAKVSR